MSRPGPFWLSFAAPTSKARATALYRASGFRQAPKRRFAGFSGIGEASRTAARGAVIAPRGPTKGFSRAFSCPPFRWGPAPPEVSAGSSGSPCPWARQALTKIRSIVHPLRSAKHPQTEGPFRGPWRGGLASSAGPVRDDVWDSRRAPSSAVQHPCYEPEWKPRPRGRTIRP